MGIYFVFCLMFLFFRGVFWVLVFVEKEVVMKKMLVFWNLLNCLGRDIFY